MKNHLKNILLSSLLAVSICGSAQVFKKGDFILGGHYQSQLMGNSPYFDNIYGITASYFVADRWALEYGISYVSTSKGVNYGKFYGGSVLAYYGLTLSSRNVQDNGYWTLALFSLLVPEGVSYHIPLNPSVTLSPYLNVLTVDLSSDYWRMSNTLGVRLNMLLKDTFNIAPHAFTTVQYRGNSVGGSVGGFGIGINAGWKF